MKAKIFPSIVLIAALSLAGSAAYYSVFGLGKLFSSQQLAVMIMAGTLEASKLIAATYLHRYWKKINILLKTYLTLAVCILMFITSLGIYGFLVSAYQTTSAELSILDQRVNIIELKKTRFTEQLSGYTEEKKQIVESISELSKGLSDNKIQRKDRETGQIITTTSSSTRKALQEQLIDFKEQQTNVSLKIESLSDSITNLDLQVFDIESTSEVAAEVGPLKYISTLLNKPMDTIVNWFILVFIFVFDPLAVILLISANKAFDIVRVKTKENIYGEKIQVKYDDSVPVEAFEEAGPYTFETDIEVEEIIKKNKEITEPPKEATPNSNNKNNPWNNTKVIS
jgi:hypothetical protein